LGATVTLLSFQKLKAQNTAPYWSLAGNSNATSSSKLGTTTATPLKIFTNNLLRMHISPNGFVGIGTTSPTYKLQVMGNALFASGVTISDSGISSNNNSGISVYGIGNVTAPY
jgi:hypothetical protein